MPGIQKCHHYCTQYALFCTYFTNLWADIPPSFLSSSSYRYDSENSVTYATLSYNMESQLSPIQTIITKKTCAYNMITLEI